MNFLPLLLIILSTILSLLPGCSGGGSSSATSVPAPAAPMAVSAVSNDGAVALSWSSSANASIYNVYSSSTTSLVTKTTGSLLMTTAVPSVTFQHTGLTNGTIYYYAVSAGNSSGEGELSRIVSAMPAPSSSTVTISGYMLYRDREYGLDGFTDVQTYKPVRHGVVELVDGSNMIPSVTDEHGWYSISASQAGSVRIRILTQASLAGGSSSINVKDLSGFVYAAGSPDLTLSGNANVNIAVPVDPVGGAFNILDVFTHGFEFVYSLEGAYPEFLNGFWEPGNPSGTYFCPAYDYYGCGRGRGIYILSASSGDTDEYDDDVLYHEFGHFAANRFSKDDSPGGYHYFTDNDLDMRLTWSEGWGDFFPGALKSELAAEQLSAASGIGPFVYVDTIGSSGWSFDFGSPLPPTGYPADTYMYATNEIAVAKILLDTRSSFGMQNIWDVITSPTFTSNSPVNLEVFWDEWLSSKPTSTGTVTLLSLFQDRQVDYSSEVASNNTYTAAQPVVIGAAQTHTLYGAGDEDYFSFFLSLPGSFAASTTGLKNGADTVITVYYPDGTTIAIGNDNWMPGDSAVYSAGSVPSDYFPALCESSYGPCHENAEDKLSSRVIFSAPSGTSYISVKASSGKPVSAGRYGQYTLSITPQP